MGRPPQPRLAPYKRHLLVCVGRRCVVDGMSNAALEALCHKLISPT